MPRVTPKGWPEHGCIQIGYDTTEQLEQIRRRLRALLFGPKDTGYYVWCEKYADWEQLIFEGGLINFRLRDRHLKKPYTDPKKGPMLDHMLVCDVVNQPMQEGMRKSIDFMLGWDDLLSDSFHLGEPAIKVYTYHASSSDHSLRGSHANDAVALREDAHDAEGLVVERRVRKVGESRDAANPAQQYLTLQCTEAVLLVGLNVGRDGSGPIDTGECPLRIERDVKVVERIAVSLQQRPAVALTQLLFDVLQYTQSLYA